MVSDLEPSFESFLHIAETVHEKDATHKSQLFIMFHFRKIINGFLKIARFAN